MQFGPKGSYMLCILSFDLTRFEMYIFYGLTLKINTSLISSGWVNIKIYILMFYQRVEKK